MNDLIINWEYYNSHFPKLSEDRFKALAYQAERLVLKRLNTTEFGEFENDVKDCICNVINELDIQREYNGVTSISNDGYSKSFATSTKEGYAQSIEDIIYQWLGDTGLIKSRWVVF